MLASRSTSHAWYAAGLPFLGAPLLATFVTLWWPWLVVTGKTPIPFMSDTNVTYGVFCFLPKTGQYDVVTITGDFPHARYASFMVYGGSRSRPFDAISDYQMKADPGSVNPFVPGEDRTATRRRYTIHAIREGSGIDPSAYDNVLVIPASETFINIMMRIYRPDDGLDIYGGVPLPTVEVGRAAGSASAPAYGLGSDLGALFKMFLGVHYKEADIFDRIHDDFFVEFYHLTREGGLPNADVPYLDTALGATEAGPGARLAVLRFRPPTFEDTHTGRGTLSGATNVRYYSFCTSDVATGFNSQCIWDDALKVDRDGMVTLVVYPPVLEERVRRSGLNRLVRGYTATTSLTYRQLLPSPDFDGAALNVPALPLPLPPDVNLDQYKASTYVAQYAPTGTYYTGPEFDAWLRHRRARKEEAEK
jgi:hypothetical protein